MEKGTTILEGSYENTFKILPTNHDLAKLVSRYFNSVTIKEHAFGGLVSLNDDKQGGRGGYSHTLKWVSFQRIIYKTVTDQPNLNRPT